MTEATFRQRAASYRDAIAAIAAELDAVEDTVPESQRTAYWKLRHSFDEALSEADGMARDAGVEPDPAPTDLDAAQTLFYEHLAANLRWPLGYDAEHKKAVVHQILGQPASEDEARQRAADWYAGNNAA